MRYTVTVNGTPVPAPRPRVTRRGTYMPAAYTAWRDEVGWHAKSVIKEPLTGPVTLLMQFRVQRGRVDLDNLVKGVLDALNGIAYHDDAQVVRLSAHKLAAPPSERGVTVYVMDNEGYIQTLEKTVMSVLERLKGVES